MTTLSRTLIGYIVFGIILRLLRGSTLIILRSAGFSFYPEKMR